LDAIKALFQIGYLNETRKLLNRHQKNDLIINGMKPDHSGAVRTLWKIYPDMEIVGNIKPCNYLSDLTAYPMVYGERFTGASSG